jgi:hypothetical protein
MSNEQRKALRKMQMEMQRNEPIVRKKLAKGKRRPAAALVRAVARHYKALDRLAKE